MQSNYKLYIDNRESKIINNNLIPNAIIKPLDIGDFNITLDATMITNEQVIAEDEICQNDNVEVNKAENEIAGGSNSNEKIIYIIERKTTKDLIGSIKDGRYYEQKTRALTLYGNTKFAYIVECENGINWVSTSKENKIIQSAIINTMMRDKIPVFVSKSIKETVCIVENIYNKLLEKGADYYTEEKVINNQDLSSQYKSCILMQSRKYKTKKNPRLVAEMQISQIPGITIKNASDLLNTLNIDTFPQFVKLYNSCDNIINTIKGIKGFGKTKVNELIKFMES